MNSGAGIHKPKRVSVPRIEIDPDKVGRVELRRIALRCVVLRRVALLAHRNQWGRKVGHVRRKCFEIECPLLEEYDFRRDTFNPNISIELKPSAAVFFSPRTLSGCDDGECRRSLSVT